jgi:hypothetical protein
LLTLKEERKLRVLENRVLRGTFRPKWGEVTGNGDNEELYDWNSSPNFIWMIKSSRMRWAGHVACMEVRRDVYRVWVWKPEVSNEWSYTSTPFMPS